MCDSECDGDVGGDGCSYQAVVVEGVMVDVALGQLWWDDGCGVVAGVVEWQWDGSGWVVSSCSEGGGECGGG